MLNMKIINAVLILFIVIAILIFVWLFIKKNFKKGMYENTQEELNLKSLINGVRSTFNSILKINVIELNLNKYETEKAERNKTELRNSFRSCASGDLQAKEYIKNYMSDLIQKQYGINEETIKIFFEKELTAAEKFEIILHMYKKQYKYKGLKSLILKYELENSSEITVKNIDYMYKVEKIKLTYTDMLEILTQKIYQSYKGLGVIDEIRDMEIDGVSCGVSGLPDSILSYDSDNSNQEKIKSYDSIWIFFQGNSINLSFLGFGNQKELERVCKNIYKYDNPGQLSEAKGYIVNEMKDGSRVVVVRPPLSESWAFWVRKFDSIKKAKVEELITDERNDIPIHVLKWLVMGCQVTGITGTQGCGKSTLLMSIVQYINERFNLRIQELNFELWLRKLYPKRNIVTFRETATVSGQEELDLQKKTDGTVNILGEVATAPVASWLIQVAQVASLFTLFTHHAKTTMALVDSLRNALLQEGGFQNETIAEEQVINVINFDVHMNKNLNGHRYIERITEIVPLSMDKVIHNYKAVDIVVWENNKYILKNSISNKTLENMSKFLDEEERNKMIAFFGGAYESNHY